VLELLNKYFAIASASLLGVSAVITIAFVFAYLAIFDWTLIWIIEYADLVKFWLLGIALFMSVFAIVSTLGGIFYVGIIRNPIRHNMVVMIVTGSLFLVLLIAWLYFADINTSFRVQIVLSVFLTAILFSMVFRFAPELGRGDDGWTIYNFLLVLIITVTALGTLTGEYVKTVNKKRYSVSLRDNSIIADAIVVMLLTHHSIFYVDKHVVLIPSTEIKKISAND
jgi:hypothetical protein